MTALKTTGATLLAVTLLASGCAVAPERQAPPDSRADVAVPKRITAWLCEDDTLVVTDPESPTRWYLFLPSHNVPLRPGPLPGVYRGAEREIRVDAPTLTLITNTRHDRHRLDCTRHAEHTFIERARLQGAEIAAMGKNPDWRLVLDRTRTRIRLPGEGAVRVRPTPPSRESNGAIVYRFSRAEPPLGVTLGPDACDETANGIAFDTRATLQTGDTTLRGCAVHLH